MIDTLFSLVAHPYTFVFSGGHFMSLIMGDYVAGFLGLSEGNAWNLDAFDVSAVSPIERFVSTRFL